MNPSVSFQESIVSLLAERKELRALFSDLTRFHLMANGEQVQETEQRISDLVTGPLPLSKYDSVTPHVLTEAVENLTSYLASSVSYESPASIWNPRTLNTRTRGNLGSSTARATHCPLRVRSTKHFQPC
jgi:hypothetical protein